MNQTKKPAPKLVKFKTSISADRIEPIEVLRETAACVFLKPFGYQIGKKTERREAKIGDYAQYHDTWADAHAYLLEKATDKVLHALDMLKLAEDKLGNIKGMKPPKESE